MLSARKGENLKRIVMIAGTDTAVGKTVISAGLVAWLNASGVKTLGMKPFACGAVRKAGQWTYEDVEMLKRANASEDIPEEMISPLRWRSPLAPFRAASIEKKPVSFSKVQSSLKYLRSQSDLVLLEGVGGLLCPLTARVTLADWVKKERIPVILVARLGLGTLNHTLMTLEVAKSRGIMVKGIILNDLSPGTSVANKLARHWNPLDIEKLVKAPLLGIFPFLKRGTVEASKKAWEKHFDLKRIKRIIKA